MSLLKPNDQLGQYTVQYLIKQGALAETYRITDREQKSFFLKLLRSSEHPASLLTDEGEPLELQVRHRLSHSAFTKLHASGRHDVDGKRCDYLVTDFLQGELVEERLQREGKFSVREALQIIDYVIEGLQYMHDQGYVHNDLTARNVMFDKDSEGDLHPRIIDMGHTSRHCSGSAPFQTSDLEPMYCATETFVGIYNPTTDLFSVGVLLYRMIYGWMPWPIETAGMSLAEVRDALRKARKEPIAFPAAQAKEEVPEAVREAISVALSGRSQRFSSLKEFRDALAGNMPVRRGSIPKLTRSGFPTEGKKSGDSDEERRTQTEDGRQLHTATMRQGGNGFEDVAGMEELKAYLHRHVIGILKDKERAEKYRLTIPNGMLLYGPPGCGKTFLAEKFAEETGFKFTLVKASDLASTYVHGSQQMISSLFNDARKHAPMVICFDEFDAIAPNRQAGPGSNHQAGEVNELLAQLNNCGKDGVFVIGTTNRPDMIDPAVLRTGRMDKHVFVPMPDKEARKGMLAINLKGRPCAEDLDLDKLAELSNNMTASDIAKLVNDAATTAAFADQLIGEELMEQTLSCARRSLSMETIAEYERLRQQYENEGGTPTTPTRRPIGYKTQQS